MSRYEEIREANILANRRHLQALGLNRDNSRAKADVPRRKRKPGVEKPESKKENVFPEERLKSSRIKKPRVDLKDNYVTAPEDQFLYCDDCNDFFLDGCSVHCLTIIDGSTLVRVGPSRIKSAGRGVFNDSGRVIERNTLFGPYLGTFYTVEEYKTKGPESGYAWEILDPSMRKVAGCTDPGSDPDPRKNWLAMVNTAPNVHAQNLAPLQYKGSIYYRVSKDIQPNVELLTHYGEDYVRTLGITEEKFYLSQPSGPKRISSRETKGGSSNGVTVEFHFCDVCGRAWMSWRSLELHRRRDHSGRSRDFNCSQCPKSFFTSNSLQNHVNLVHVKGCSHACNLCDYASYSRHNLDLHYKTVHLNHRDEICPICDKGFGQKINLNIHIKTVHNQIRDFKCTICDKLFGKKGHLNRHIKTVHNKIRDFKCTICNQALMTKQNLNIHIKTVHNKIRDFKCTICDKGFGIKGDLNNHIKTVHNKIRDFKCTICNQAFGIKKDLNVHIKKIHT